MLDPANSASPISNLTAKLGRKHWLAEGEISVAVLPGVKRILQQPRPRCVTLMLPSTHQVHVYRPHFWYTKWCCSLLVRCVGSNRVLVSVVESLVHAAQISLHLHASLCISGLATEPPGGHDDANMKSWNMSGTESQPNQSGTCSTHLCTSESRNDFAGGPAPQPGTEAQQEASSSHASKAPVNICM